ARLQAGEGDLPAVRRPGRKETSGPRLDLAFMRPVGVDDEDPLRPTPMRIPNVLPALRAEHDSTPIGRPARAVVGGLAGMRQAPAMRSVGVHRPQVAVRRRVDDPPPRGLET